MAKYRGKDHGMTESQYNSALLRVALENDISVIGLADHGNVEGIDVLRQLLTESGIVVFPGFEITSTEKVHFVCLFPETTDTTQLNMYLGALDVTDPTSGVSPSKLGGIALMEKVEELGGITYAAHCTEDSGILQRKLDHVWKHPLLKAAQIPATLDNLRNHDDNKYRKILLNKDPNYSRELPIAVINAKDVAEPTDLVDPRASCLIKMTRPCFESFQLAFLDPESRVRLNSDVSENFYSRIERMKVIGGYLEGLDVELSDNLNAVIGGRGAGKSTLIECIRYALMVQPIGKSALKQHTEIVKENLGKSKARVELVIRSSQMKGARFTVARRFGEMPSVTDEYGNPSAFSPADLLPNIEIYGQNEILEIAQDFNGRLKLLSRFLQNSQGTSSGSAVEIEEDLSRLKENTTQLIEAQEQVAVVEEEALSLPKLEEQVRQFKRFGVEEKLKVVPLLETERRLISETTKESNRVNDAFQDVRVKLPNTAFLNEQAIEDLPHAERFRELQRTLGELRNEAEGFLSDWNGKYAAIKLTTETLASEIMNGIKDQQSELDRVFKDIPAFENKSGPEIGAEFQNLTRQIENVRQSKHLVEQKQEQMTFLRKERQVILDDLSRARAERSAHYNRTLKRLNKRLVGKLKLTVNPESDTSPIRDFLLECQLENIGPGRLIWLKTADDFSPVKLAELVRRGEAELLKTDWGITPTVAAGLTKLTFKQLLQLEELEMADTVDIELNTAHDNLENFRTIEKLSTGQQCTAVLHLLLLKNVDPLIMDQPEDNLDNAFIAERIVSELRSAKVSRQFLFATHNANIPVFGDAEWIGVLESSQDQGYIPLESQGAIDVPLVRNKAANILEGGKVAFNQRKTKYGF